jgi:hypothetical protein
MAVYAPSGSGNVHVDVVLTTISVAWPNEGLVGNFIFPAVPVQKQSNKYYIFQGREGWYPDLDDARAPGTEANEIPGLTVSVGSYYCQEHALQLPVTDEERQNADSPLSPDVDGAELLASRIALGKEYRIYNLVTTSSNFNSTLTQALGDTPANGYGVQWDGQLNAGGATATAPTPVKDIRLAMRMVHKLAFLQPNQAVIPYKVMSALEDSTDLISRIQYVERAVLTPDLVASLLSLSNVVVPGFGIATNNPGQVLALQYLWSAEVLFAYAPPRPGLKVPAFGYQFVWGFGGQGGGAGMGFGSGSFSGQGIENGLGQNALNPSTGSAGDNGNLSGGIVDRWREERRASDLLRFRQRYDLELIGLDTNNKAICGFLFTHALSNSFQG